MIPAMPFCQLGSATTVETPPPPVHVVVSPSLHDAEPSVTLVSTPELVYVKFTPPIEVKYGSPAGVMTPLDVFKNPHSLEPVSPDDAENSTPSAAPCCAIAFVALSNEVSLDSQAPNDEFTAAALP